MVKGQWGFKRVLFIQLIVVILIVGMVTTFAGEEKDQEILEESKQVLYISSYSPSIIVFPQQLDGIKKRFAGQPIVLDVEFMDSKRFYTEENFQNFYNNLKYKLDNGLHYDAVIVGDDNGLEYLMAHKSDLFPETPIFFLGINSLERAEKSSQDPLVTGVVEAKSIFETIEFGQYLNPKANRVVSLIDNTASSIAEAAEVRELEERFDELEFYYLDMSTYSREDYFDQVGKLEKTDIVMHLSAITDKDGNVMTYDEMRHRHDDILDLPIYGLTTIGIGDGMFGGKVVSHEDQGVAAADMAMRYFKGTPMDEIIFSTQSPNVYMLDYQQFKEFGFDKSKLTQDVVLVKREFTFWEKYGLYVLLILVIIVIESAIILLLIRNIQAKRRSEKKLIESQHKIEQVNKELLETVDVLNITNSELEDSIMEVNERDGQIKEMIYRDKLTGLMTRHALDERLSEILLDQERRIAIVLLDIDNFKNVNDAFGHQFGDQVIQKIGNRLKTLMTHQIDVCRFGGDEFIIVVKDYDKRSIVEDVVKQIHELFEAMVSVESNRFFLTTSIGVALFPEHGLSHEELMKHADVALHDSKDSGKDKFTFYDNRMDLNFHDKIHFQNLLRNAFKNNEFYLNYQPLVSAKDHEVYGFEALIRWKSEELGQVSPFRLITEAEEMGMIIKIGEWVFREAVAFSKELNSQGKPAKYISINVSAVQLMYSGFFKNIVSIIEEMGVKAETICLEMTETALIGDIDLGRSIIKQFSDYGFKIALDDFGTGYSSLNYLKHLPIDILKIDKTFVDHIGESSYDRYLVEAIIKIAKERNIVTVAEGVEDIGQYTTLTQMNCSMIQGYLFSKPLAKEDAVKITRDGMYAKVN